MSKIHKELKPAIRRNKFKEEKRIWEIPSEERHACGHQVWGKMAAESLLLMRLAVIKKMTDQKAGEVWEAGLHMVGGNVEKFSPWGPNKN